MAHANSSEFTRDLLLFCENKIKSELEILTRDQENKNISLLKRSKDLKRGDFLAIVQYWKTGNKQRRKTHTQAPAKHGKHLPYGTDGHIDVNGHSNGTNGTHTNGDLCQQNGDSFPPANPELRKKEAESIGFESLNPFKASVCEVTECSDILIKLQRPEVCKNVILAVERDGRGYGSVEPALSEAAVGRKRVSINVAELLDCDDWSAFSVNYLRSMLISEHISFLLRATGHEVDVLPHKIDVKWKEIVDDFSISSDKYSSQNPANLQDGRENLKLEIDRMLRDCKYFVKLDRQEIKQDTSDDSMLIDADCNKQISIDSPIADCDMCQDQTEADVDPTVISLKSYLEDAEIIRNYDKNINVADFSVDSERLRDVAYLEHHRRTRNDQDSRPDVLIHVVPQDKSFYMQTLDIGWQIINSDGSPPARQIHLVHGPVNSRGGQLPIFQADDLLRLRRKQMTSASVMKYGDLVQGPGWDVTIEALTVAAIKFEILSTTCRQQVKLDILVDPEESGQAMDNRGGVFVMYNCARLSNLFSRYNQAVEQGTYPELPEAETLDFSMLKAEEEWALVFNYLLPFPTMLRECVLSSDQTVRSQILTHKVSQFLQDLSRDLSSYYSRVHILGEPRPHLYPAMFCRLHLLRAVQQVMCNGLALLGITPLSQL